MPATKVVVNIPGERPYDVRIGEGVLDALGRSLKAVSKVCDAPQLLIITDDHVAPLYLERTRASLQAAGFRTADITVPAGEPTKSLEVIGEVWEAMGSLSLTRDCAVVALGGGVIGDLAGFAASCYMRGIPVVQVPTTLLSMVDSSVGGKTAVNLGAGKNMVGSFMQPSFVCASTDTLATLDDREWRCGLAEVAKSAAIDSDDFFFWMLERALDLDGRDSAAVAEAIARCVVFKAGIVAEDKTESRGVRECLNYGHTYGHAVESLSGYGTYSHGAAVAEGMRFAARLAQRILGASEDFVATQDDLLDSLGLHALPWKAEPHAVLEAMKRDKKSRGGSVRFVLLRDVAQWELVTVDDAVILQELAAWDATKA